MCIILALHLFNAVIAVYSTSHKVINYIAIYYQESLFIIILAVLVYRAKMYILMRNKRREVLQKR